MKKKWVLIDSASIFVLLAIAVFGSYFVLSIKTDTYPAYPYPLVYSQKEQSSVNIEDPDRLIIPDIGIDSHIQDVGITFAGNMGVPNNFTDVGWYKNGPLPGMPGNSVIDGHVDNGLGFPAVFSKLKDLKIGDMVYVQDKNGARVVFEVKKIEVYDHNDAPLEEIFGPNDKQTLNLITCSGVWLSKEKTDDKRLVIYTERVD